MMIYSTDINDATAQQILLILDGQHKLKVSGSVMNLNIMSCTYLDDDFESLESLDENSKVLLIKVDSRAFSKDCDEMTLALIDEDFFSEHKSVEFRNSAAVYIKNRLLLNYSDNYTTKVTIIEKIKDFIHAHLDEKLSVEMLSQEFDLSRMKLIRLFQKNNNCSVMAYVKIRRIEKAKFLLEESDLSVNQIASSCGFADTASFSHFVKKNMDKSPRQIREEKQWLM